MKKLRPSLVLPLVTLGIIGCNDSQEELAVEHSDNIEQSIHYGQASPTLYPEMTLGQQNAVVALVTKNYGDYNFNFCTGVLVAPKVVLTAAHCLTTQKWDPYYEDFFSDDFTQNDIVIHVGIDSKNPIAVYELEEAIYKRNSLGQNYWQAGYWDRNECNDIGCDENGPYLEPDYSIDVAVLILKEPVTNIQTIKLHNGRVDDLFGKDVQAVGYGYANEEHGGLDNAKRWWATTKMVGYHVGQIGTDGENVNGTDHGDSGSPLLYDFGNGIEVIGNLSTGFEGTFISAYTPVSINERWIRSYIYKYENQECAEICQDIECGVVNGCACSSCGPSLECVQNTCQPLPVGQGGVCYTTENIGYSCQDDSDCNEGFVCVEKDDNVNVCMKKCSPKSCSKTDKDAICYPVDFYPGHGLYYPLCISNNASKCPDNAEELSTCTTADGTIGHCISDLSDNNMDLYCYAFCQVAKECASSEFCIATEESVIEYPDSNTESADTATDDITPQNPGNNGTDPDTNDHSSEQTDQNQKHKKGCNSQAGDVSLLTSLLLSATCLLFRRKKSAN